MNYDDIQSQFKENMRRDNAYAQSVFSREEDKQFQEQQITRIISEYQNTNNRLEEINLALQRQINDAQNETKAAKKKAFLASMRSWISLGFTAGSLIVAIIALCLR